VTFTADEIRDMNMEAKSLEGRRLAYLEQHGFMSDHLASMVEDQKCQAANAINNKGMRVQLRYLLQNMPWKEVVESLQASRKVLERYHKKSESKWVPGKNK
jgi:hypothetical protein